MALALGFRVKRADFEVIAAICSLRFAGFFGRIIHAYFGNKKKPRCR
jgi:hypothetical protein